MSQILNSNQVAELLGCSIRTVEDHARSGTLKGTKFGDGWIFLSDMVIEDIRTKCIEEADQRKKPKATLTQVKSKTKAALPGMAHMPLHAIRQVLGA